jgi:hypothetical protein
MSQIDGTDKKKNVTTKKIKRIKTSMIPRVNFTNTSRAAFTLIFLSHKSNNLIFKHKEDARFVQKAAHKILVKLTPALQHCFNFDFIENLFYDC